MKERLFVCFEYDAIDLSESDINRIMLQLKTSVVPPPPQVIVAIGPTAQRLHDVINYQRMGDES